MAGYRYIYNETIALLRCFDGVVKFGAFDLDKIVQQIETLPDFATNLPGHQRQEAINEAVDAFRRAKSDGGEAKFKSRKATSQAIQFKVGNFKNGTWYPRTTKGLKFTSKQPIPGQSAYGTELVYCRGKWFGCFPQVVEVSQTESDKVIALDPGNRTFLTGFDGENVIEIGKADIGRIQRLCLHLDDLISRFAKATAKRRYRMRKAANRVRERIQNLVKDLHSKATALLTEHYKAIYLPTFNTSQMAVKVNGKGKKRKINSKSVRQMLTWCHYKFEQHLKQAALRKGVIVVDCNESYTSKTCTQCGHVHHKLGGAKIFKCPHCGAKTSRDVNGARNIMIRALQATAFIVKDDAFVVQSSLCTA